jgi:hypothetical protein
MLITVERSFILLYYTFDSNMTCFKYTIADRGRTYCLWGSLPLGSRHGKVMYSTVHTLFTTANQGSQLGNRHIIHLLYPLVNINHRRLTGYPGERQTCRLVAEITSPYISIGVMIIQNRSQTETRPLNRSYTVIGLI